MTTPRPIPTVGEPLAEALHLLRMDGMFYCQSELSSPWGVTMPPMPGSIWFHVVAEGSAELTNTAGQVHQLQKGDVAVLPLGVGHTIADTSTASMPNVFDVPHEYLTEHFAIMTHGGGGRQSTILCGVAQTGSPAARMLMQQLPEVIVIDAATSGSDWLWFPHLMALVASETRTMRPGGETVITRLCDVLIIQAIRAWVERDDTPTGWLAALRDPTIGRAITMMHADPTHAWTVTELAEHAAMSRSAFSARFVDLVGQPPKQYLTTWRMELAQSLLDDNVPIRQIAGQLGYGSEAAFSRAFKRVTGTAPSHHRRDTLSSLSTSNSDSTR